jgi:predicted lipoprotein
MSETRKTILLVSGIFLLMLLAFASAGCAGVAVIRPLAPPTLGGSEAQGSSFRTSKGFDPVTYVNGLWDSKILPQAESKAVALPVLLTALNQDKAAASQKYGHKESGPYNFAVKVDGVIDAVDTTSRAGTVLIKPTGYTGPAEVRLQIGPVMRGTAIRDGSGLIPFNQFVNQIEYADVGEALNNRVLDTVLKGVDFNALKGKPVTVYGYFTLDNLNKILITPVKIETKS